MLMRIAFDMDEVLVSYLPQMNKYFERQYNRKPIIPYHKVKRYNFSEIYGISPRESQWLVYGFYNSEEHKNMEPVNGMQEFVDSLKHDNELYIITARQHYGRQQTMDLIHKHYGNTFKDVIFTNSYSLIGNEDSKRDICNALSIDMLIDDNINNLIDLNDTYGMLFAGYPWS